MFSKTRQPGTLSLLVLGHFLAMAAMEMSGPFWPLILRDTMEVPATSLVFWSGVTYALPVGLAIVSIPFWGRVGDSSNHKLMLLRAVCALALTQFALCFATSLNSLLFLRAAQGLLAGVIAAAVAYAMNTEAIPQKGKAIAQLQAATAAGSLIGPVVGGLLTQTKAGYSHLFFSAALITAAITILFGLLLPSDKPTPTPSLQKNSPSSHGSPPQALFMIVAATIILAQMSKMMPLPLITLRLSEILSFGHNNLMIAVIYALSGLATLATAPLFGIAMERVSLNRVLWLTAVLAVISAGAVLLQGFADNLIVLALSRLVWGIGLAAFVPLAYYLLKVRLQATGRLLATACALSKLGTLIGFLISTLLAFWLGLQNAFLFIAFSYLMLASLFMVLAHRDCHQPSLQHTDPGR